MNYSKLSLWLVGLMLPTCLFAATNQFTVEVLVGDDNNPPTTPTLLEVTPISAQQINVSWSAATDDVLLGGYVLLRDGVPIATTTLTNFSDTGLQPETRYEYAVYAFDWIGNISTTSNMLATTTLAWPLPPPPAPTTVATRPPTSRTVLLHSLAIETTKTTAAFTFVTDRPARYLLRWGRTEAVTGGYIESQVFQTKHYTVVSDLEPGTVYFYELVAFTPALISVVLDRGQFTTKARVVPLTPVNVSDLTLTVVGEDVRLSYLIPEGEVRAVRIVRNHLFYPADMYDGAVVFEGLRTTWLDRGALQARSPQYYSVFVIMADGSVSSGALGRVERAREAVEVDPPVLPSAPTPPAGPEILPADFSFERSEIVVVQGGREQSFGQDVVLEVGLPVTVRISREALPRHLKSIIVYVVDPSDQRVAYAYLLKLSRDGLAYEATFPAPRVKGESRLRLDIYDFEAAVIARYQVPVSVVESTALKPTFLEDTLISSFTHVGYLLVLLALLGLFLILARRRRD